MKLIIIGATGGTGRALVEQSLAQGDVVTAFVRNPVKMKTVHARLVVVKGDVLDYDSLETAVRGQDAVLSALGHKRFFLKNTILSDGTKNIIRAMEKHKVKKLIFESSLGVGDSKGKLGLYYTLFVIPFIIFFYYRDKELAERYIRESSLDWTIVRPGQLTDGKKRGVYREGLNVGNWFSSVRISRADVADFMLKHLTDNSYLKKTPGVAY
jgi:putative NADH-flavin reductase